MKKKLFSLIGCGRIILLLAACGNDEVNPVDINEATDTCEDCNMAVVNDQHATQIVLDNGKSCVFDDIGCMYEWLATNENKQIAAQFVRDYNDKEWILVDDATLCLQSNRLKRQWLIMYYPLKIKLPQKNLPLKMKEVQLMTANDLAQHVGQNQDMMQKNIYGEPFTFRTMIRG